jgi:hypothetical protein
VRPMPNTSIVDAGSAMGIEAPRCPGAGSDGWVRFQRNSCADGGLPWAIRSEGEHFSVYHGDRAGP